MTANGRNFLALGKCPTQDEILSILDDISLEDLEEAKGIIARYDDFSIVNVTGK